MARWQIAVAGTLVLIIGALVWWMEQPVAVHPPTAAPAPVAAATPGTLRHAPAPNARDVRRLEPASDGILLLPEAAALAYTLNSPGTAPEHDLETLTILLDLFQRANNGAIPEGGLNEEIVAGLCGRNARHFAVLPADCPGLSPAGELLDRWGTPYFLHPLSREILQIRSAGPDRKFGTADDLDLHPDAGADIKR